MELAKGKKANLINKTWQRCKSIGRGLKSSTSSPPRVAAAVAVGMTKKSKSWPRMITLGSPEAQEYHHQCQEKRESTLKKVKGCFSVYVGPEKQKFMVKTEYANHPLFKMLLEEAESEFGYDSQGPLMLPCNVDIFYRVLMEMDDDDDNGAATDKIHPGCGFVKRHASYHLLSPSRMVAINQF
ncbi:Small auxin-up RNA [Parasponia andersonii]|uniref:Small auxin-up RNA n=1 Tax=Parasponia andersonii TaxID=3476 RepID=A0A2P5BSV6_PARAD|nr:Small auxin-up RNA [Parasponia andersonii]